MRTGVGQFLVVDVAAATAGLTFSVGWTARRLDGRLVIGQQSLAAGAVGSGAAMSIPLIDGELLEVRVGQGGSGAQEGLLWAEARVLAGEYPNGQMVARLVQGWPPLHTELVWSSGSGFVKEAWPSGATSIAPATPAAGAEMTLDLSAWEVGSLLKVQGKLVCSAAVAVRIPNLLITDALGNTYRISGSATVAGSGTLVTTWGRFGVIPTTSGGMGYGMLPDTSSVSGLTLATSTTLIDAADQWSDLSVVVLGGQGSLL